MHSILVIGGGPAGCAAALLLARWGHDVMLVARPSVRAVALAESLTPSCQKFFDLLGVSEAIDAAGFVRTTGNTVWWGPDDTRVEMFANGARGWQATSTTLERVLLASARDAGARIEWRAVTPEEAAACPAAYRLDCTGRTGLLARVRGERRYEEGHRTVALSATWQRAEWPLPDPTHTLIESYADGWAWSVPLDETRRAVAVMVDPRTTAMARGAGARSAYLAEIAKTRRLATLLEPALMIDGPTGWDASMYASARYAGPGWLLVGDAASFVDPLSSAGVRKALASGWLAAVATHTALARPSMAEIALDFFAAREADVYARFLALTRRFLADAAQGRAHPFWTDRAEMVDGDPSPDDAGRARVQAAHERIRRAPALDVHVGAGVRVEPRPAISAAEIVLERRLVTDDLPAGVRFVDDIDVVALVELAPTHRHVPALYDACVRRSGPMDLASFLAALATAVARGWLVEKQP